MKIKIQIQDIFFLAFIGSATLGVISRNLPLGMGSTFYVWSPIVLILILSYRSSVFTKESVRIILLYGILSVGVLQYSLWRYMSDWNRIHIFLEFYYLFVTTAVLFYYLSRGSFSSFGWLSKWAFIFIIISLILTNIALYLDPYIVRDSASSGDFSSYQRAIFSYTGAMGYGYLQAIITLIPILIYYIKRKIRMVFSTKVLIVILLVIIITEIRAQVFANILVTFLILTLALFGLKNWKASFFSLIFVIGLFLITPISFFTSSLNSISLLFDSDSEIYYKLTDLSVFIENPDIDTSTGVGARTERYPLLYRALIANPFFGNTSYNSSLNIELGGHLYWMNRLALWGIFGFLFFIYVLYKIFSNIIPLFNHDFQFYYFISILSVIFLGLIKAVGGIHMWLMLIVIIPGMYFYPLIDKKRIQQNKEIAFDSKVVPDKDKGVY